MPHAMRELEQLGGRLARCPTYVGEPRWSSTTDTSSCCSPSASIVLTKFLPVQPKSHDERTIQPSPTSRSPSSFVRPYSETGFRLVRLDVRPALAAVEDVVGREVDDRSAERDDVSGPIDVDSRCASGSASAPSTSVQAAACRTRSGR